MDKVTNVLFVGIGGQGVLKASDVLARAAFLAGGDVKKSEIHGMSQRGGGVTSTVRFGAKVYSPLAPEGRIDFIVAYDRAEGDKHLKELARGGRIVYVDEVPTAGLSDARTANVALLGRLAGHLGISDEVWERAIREEMPEKFVATNLEAFRLGRRLAG